MVVNPIPGRDGQIAVYPLEMLQIIPDQRVPLEKMDPTMIDRLLTANSITPEQRMQQILRHANQMELFSGKNAILRAFGIQVQPHSNSITIGVRQPPSLRFGGPQRSINPMGDRANWARDAQRLPYLQAARVDNWLVLHPERDTQLVEDFLGRLQRTMGQKGMRFGSPTLVAFPRGFSVQIFNGALEASPKAQLLLLIDWKRDETHGLLKYLEASTKKVLTQQLAMEKVRDVVTKNQMQTLENIAHKVNMKCFGLNYAPTPEPSA